LIELENYRRGDLDQMERNEENIKGMFDHKSRERYFNEGYQVLMWYKRKKKPVMHKKFDSLWTRP